MYEKHSKYKQGCNAINTIGKIKSIIFKYIKYNESVQKIPKICLFSKFKNDKIKVANKYEPKNAHKDAIITNACAILEEVSTIGKSPKRKIILVRIVQTIP